MTVRKTVGTGTAAVITATVLFLPGWEGMDKVAKRDMIGTGHPITYCNGLTSHDGKVNIGQRFTKEECDKRLAEALPKYLEEIGPCITRPVPVKVAAALLDGAWNAGSHRVCTSPMVANINAGKIRAGCNAFAGWIIRSDGQVRKGLIARRDGEDHGDPRLSEKGFCLQGVNDPKSAMYSYAAQSPVDGVIAHATSINSAPAPAPYVCAHRQAEAGECLPLIKPPAVCGGEWVNDQTYTPHPECRKPAPLPKPRPAATPAASQKHWWSWIFK